MKLDAAWLDDLLGRAVAEDVGPGDATTLALVPEQRRARARVVSREEGVIAGLAVIARLPRHVQPTFDILPLLADGARVSLGTAVAELAGPARSLLTAERLLLNILQRMSGIATATRRLVDLVHGTGAVICDTRKTAPGLRFLDKAAVALGGGVNHRAGLHDMILIKDNHLASLLEEGREDPLAEAVRRARAAYPDLAVEVEVDTLEQLARVLPSRPEMILLDNMPPETLRKAVAMTWEWREREGEERRPLLEASGNVTEKTIAAIAHAGVERISLGALTHSVRALDLGLDWGS
jgi:nicotinate-nucleotide pyrophosphorylase (carboxylating)